MALLCIRTPNGHRIDPVEVSSVPEAMALLDARGHALTVGIYLEDLGLAVDWCQCQTGCPACHYSRHRIWQGKGPLAPFIGTEKGGSTRA